MSRLSEWREEFTLPNGKKKAYTISTIKNEDLYVFTKSGKMIVDPKWLKPKAKRAK